MLIVRNGFTRKTANLNGWRETSSTRRYLLLAIQSERCNPARRRQWIALAVGSAA
jgi:hypothetical protein